MSHGPDRGQTLAIYSLLLIAETGPMSDRLFSRQDLSGFWALFADNLANMVIAAAVCGGLFQIPDRIILGRIIPGLAVALLLGLSFYAWQAQVLARREARDDVTALPYGISTPVLFVTLFLVMKPVHDALSATMSPEDAGIAAWQVALAASFLGGLIEMAGSVLGPVLKRITPRAGMLGTLAGISLVFIAAAPMAEVMEHPIVGFASFAIILLGLIGGLRLPGAMPAGLAAILAGVGVALLTGLVDLGATPTAGLGLHPPVPVIGDLWVGLGLLFVDYPHLIAVIIPIEVYNFIETMNNVESAEAAGDAYPVGLCQVADGAGTIIGACFGAPFPTTVYIGHPAYKKLGARSGYALMVGAATTLIALFGLMRIIDHLIPVAAIAPILVYIGISLVSQAFRATPESHGPAVALAMLPHIADFLVVKLRGAVQASAGFIAEAGGPITETLGALRSGVIPDGLAQRMAAQASVHYTGQLAMSRGAIIVGLLWGAIAARVIDRRTRAAAAFALAAAALSALGLIHAPGGLGLDLGAPALWAYALAAGLIFGVGELQRKGDLERSVV